jgi:hypothetical protein
MVNDDGLIYSGERGTCMHGPYGHGYHNSNAVDLLAEVLKDGIEAYSLCVCWDSDTYQGNCGIVAKT